MRSQTAGGDGNVSSIALPGGIYTLILGVGVYYPNGDETQRVGIRIDKEIRSTINGIRQGKDELLEKAIEIIKEKKGSKKRIPRISFSKKLIPIKTRQPRFLQGWRV